MPRIPYVSDPPKTSNSEDEATVTRIRDRRIESGHSGLIELDRMLLHAPPLANGWNSFLGAVRNGTTLPDDIREIMICRVAVLNEAQYEWADHAPILRTALKQMPELQTKKSQTAEESEKRLDWMVDALLAWLQQRDVVQEWLIPTKRVPNFHWLERYEFLIPYVDAMTVNVNVPEKVFTNMRQRLPEGAEGDRQMVEITTTCAAYNCVSRFLVAMDVGDMNK